MTNANEMAQKGFDTGFIDANDNELHVGDYVRICGHIGKIVFSCGAFGIFIADEVPWDALEELVRKDSGNRASFLYNDTFISFWEIVWNLSEDTDEPCLPYVESITATGGIFTDENGNKDVFMDFKPDYQRGSVWDEEDREKLLDSIFAGREIGRFVFKQLPFNRTNDDGNYYEIVDGKQRMLTLLAFYENRFPYKGAFYNDLSALDKNWFMDASIGVAELDQNTTRAEVLEVFLALNEGGKPVAKEVLDHARELLKGETGNGEM